MLAFKERDWIVLTDFENLTSDAVFDRSLRLALEVAIAQSRFVNVFPPNRVQEALRAHATPGGRTARRGERGPRWLCGKA